MKQISVGTSTCYLDFMLIGALGEPLIVSYFNRSLQEVRAVNASLLLDGVMTVEKRVYRNENKFNASFATIQKSKERFTHGIAFARNLKKDYLITTEQELYKDLYNLLMNQFNLPLLEWWMPEVFKEMVDRRFLNENSIQKIIGNNTLTIKRSGRNVCISDLKIMRLTLTEEALNRLISGLFKKRKIWITKTPQKPLHFENIDEYFQMYGKSIVDNMKKVLEPVSELNGKIDRAVLNTMRLYPQQAAMSNGVVDFFRKTKNTYSILSMGTGSGKTIQAAVIAEMLHVSKWLDRNPGKTLADAYAKDGVINYRNFIMCPGHLVKKWQKELLREIPYSKAVIIENFSQLVKLREAGAERISGKEWYILSKDFTKLSYQRIPTPKKEAVRQVQFFKCNDCGATLPRYTDKCFACESKNIGTIRTRYKRKGLICPSCNRLLFPMDYVFDTEIFDYPENKLGQAMHWYDMSAERNNNQRCIYCRESLWTPFVKNINTEFGWSREPDWIRQTFWANKSKKGKVTNWVLCGHENEAKKLYGEVLNSMENSTGGCRKYSPALYIKKYLKGYIDVFICDEVHKAKGGSTAQGNAFHQVMKSAKYTLALTGTIAGGMATDLFYLLYRMEPGRMKKKGFDWNSVMKFANEYGCVQTEYAAEYDMRNNACSRGRQLGRPKVIPGISPLVFSEFLLDRAVFLDIPDMSEHMPPLYEYIKLCKPQSKLEEQMHSDYNKLINYLKKYEREVKVNLTSVRNQFSMSYLDKPYGVEEIRDPKSGCVVYEPKDYRILIEEDGLLAKERLLVDIVKKELSEGRNCVIYAEYTQSVFTNVMPRLQEILSRHCNLNKEEIVAMKANFPSASAREEWMHKQAKEGMKVMICNPRLCETGLDFCWDECGIIYNYPTLIFYQSGYSLFVMWQAAGRAWRLNQREECRTYYLAYEKTVQQAILQVLGEKKAATAAIQGRFSADGLAAMARGVDTQVRIAQIMSEMDEHTENTLQKMFDVITGEKESSFGDEQTMLLFSELVTKVQKIKEAVSVSPMTLFDMFNQMMPKEEGQKKSEVSMISTLSQFNSFIQRMDLPEIEKPAKKQKRVRKDKYKMYECSLF